MLGHTHFPGICISVTVSAYVSPSSCFLLSLALLSSLESGVALIQTLSTLTGLEVRAPMGLATGSFQNSESPLRKTDSAEKRQLKNVCQEPIV